MTSRFFAASQQRWMFSLCLVAKQPAARFHYIYSAVLLVPRAAHVLFSVTFRFPFLFLVGPPLRSTTHDPGSPYNMIKEFILLTLFFFFICLNSEILKEIEYRNHVQYFANRGLCVTFFFGNVNYLPSFLIHYAMRNLTNKVLFIF